MTWFDILMLGLLGLNAFLSVCAWHAADEVREMVRRLEGELPEAKGREWQESHRAQETET